MSNKENPADLHQKEGLLHRNNTTSRRRLLHLLGAGGVAGLAGCFAGGDGNGGGSNNRTDTEPSGDGTSEKELQQSATIAHPDPPVTSVWQLYGNIRPYYTRVVEPLIWVTDGLKIEPWLAKGWNSTGEKTWEFKIREEVKFHNGSTLTADEVIFSFKKFFEKNEWATGFLNLKPEGITKVDDSTVEFENTDPFPVFPESIAINAIAIQHPDAADKEHEVIGTGPYQVDEVKPDQFLKTVAFDKYWNGTPKTPELTFQSIVDANTRVLSLKNHEIDIAFSPPKGKVGSLRNAENIDVITKADPRVGYFGINIYNSPIDDVKLRRGLNYAVSQELIVKTLLNGIGEPAKGPISPLISWSAHKSLPDYGPDKDKARNLIKQSDYNGEALKLGVSKNRTDNKLLAEHFKQVAEEVGVTIDIQLMEEAAYDELIQTGDFHLRLMEIGTRSGAADYIMFDLFHTKGLYNQAQYKKNGTGLFNLGGEVDSLIDKGQQTADTDVKKEAYGEAIHRIMENAVIIPIYYKEYVVAKRNDIEGIDLSPIDDMVRWKGMKHLK